MINFLVQTLQSTFLNCFGHENMKIRTTLKIIILLKNCRNFHWPGCQAKMTQNAEFCPTRLIFFQVQIKLKYKTECLDWLENDNVSKNFPFFRLKIGPKSCAHKITHCFKDITWLPRQRRLDDVGLF